MQSQKNTPSKLSGGLLWYERFMALVALANLGLVLFDLSYVPWRDFYLRRFWNLGEVYEPLKKVDFHQLYDPYKSIEPHRDTQKYLDTLDELKAQVKQNSLQSPQVEAVLQSLRDRSVEMINENPFQVANKSGTLEKIKNRMRLHIFGSKEASSKQSFERFWTQSYLAEKGFTREIEYFERRIQPLIASNYYRNLGENGEFIDNFWKLDRWFIGLFFVEFLVRTWLISRGRKGWRSIPDAMLWRWYDIFLLLPFLQLLRVIPVTIRLHQAKFPDLEPIRNKLSRLFVTSFAEELTEVVVIQAIDQMKDAVEKGDLIRAVFQPANKPYIDINETNEVEAIAKRLLQVTLCKVLPEIQTDLEAVLRHNIENILKQSPIYQQLLRMPGLGRLPTQLTERLVTEISKLVTEGPQNAYTAIATAPIDPIATQLSDRLVKHFSEALRNELQQQHTIDELQGLLCDLLEEIKLNYVKRVEAPNNQQILEEMQQRRRQAGR